MLNQHTLMNQTTFIPILAVLSCRHVVEATRSRRADATTLGRNGKYKAQISFQHIHEDPNDWKIYQENERPEGTVHLVNNQIVIRGEDLSFPIYGRDNYKISLVSEEKNKNFVIVWTEKKRFMDFWANDKLLSDIINNVEKLCGGMHKLSSKFNDLFNFKYNNMSEEETTTEEITDSFNYGEYLAEAKNLNESDLTISESESSPGEVDIKEFMAEARNMREDSKETTGQTETYNYIPAVNNTFDYKGYMGWNKKGRRLVDRLLRLENTFSA